MYAKVFRQMFYGSMIGQAPEIVVFVCLLVHCDKDGNGELPPAVISTLTGVASSEVDAIMSKLSSPDPNSRSNAEDGRRILLHGNGFGYTVVNYQRYRSMRDEDARREQTRRAVTKHRKANESHGKPNVSQGKPQKAQAEAEADTEAEAEAEAEAGESTHLVSGADRAGVSPRRWRQIFDLEFWPRYPRKVAKQSAANAWMRIPVDSDPGEIIRGLSWYMAGEWTGRPTDKIPHAATWINQQRWKDAVGQPLRPNKNHDNLSARDILDIAERMREKENA